MIRLLRNTVSLVIALILISLGYLSRAKRNALAEGNLIILCFHNPRKKHFEKIVLWLKKNGFTIVNTGEVTNHYLNRRQLPAGAVWITLDDGWRGNLVNVLPALEANKVNAAIFVSSGVVASGGVYWWTLAQKYHRMLPENFHGDISMLWKIPEAERRKVIDKLTASVTETQPRQALTADELKQISSSEFVAIGSHTVNHVITTNCTDEELSYELERSKQMLEEWTGKTVEIFAYPNADHNGREEASLKKAGYKLAVIAENRAASINDNPYQLPRMVMGEDSYYEDLLHIFGVWQKFMKRIK